MYTQDMEQCNEVFESKRYDNVLSISFNNRLDFFISECEQNAILLTFLNNLLQEPDIKVVILHGPAEQLDKSYFEVFESWSEIKQHSKTILKICNDFDQFILNLVNTDKIIVSATAEKTELGFFTLSLACDYRIVTDNFTIQPPKTKCGLILRDSAEYFLAKIMGTLKTIEFTTLDRDINAKEMLQLGLIDQIVPSDDQSQLMNSAIKKADDFACFSPLELKKLKKYQANKLIDYFKFKNRRLLDFITNKVNRVA
jgi:enoyl-CoA hydratase/carnithine racemase